MEETTYQALITITLPNNEKATAHITLTPPDTVDSGGRVKTLSDCTLAEIQEFADELELDVWKTYQSINLLELEDNDHVHVEVAVLGRRGQRLSTLQNWLKQRVLLTGDGDETAAAVADPQQEPEPVQSLAPPLETAVEEPSPPVEEPAAEVEEVEEAVEKTPPADPQPEEAVEEEDDLAISIIAIAESEPVHPEREAELSDPSKPVIADSQARVRIAGTRLPAGHPTWMAVDILIEEPALRAAQAHALSSMDREVAGVMVGSRPEKQPDGRYLVRVVDTIIAKYTVMNGASVTYTPESWRYLNDKLEERYPNETAVMVGWYHTHPGFGIFLSGMDLFIHQNFFTQIWHTALVLDPRAKTSGFFCWNREKTAVKPVNFQWPSWAPRGW